MYKNILTLKWQSYKQKKKIQIQIQIIFILFIFIETKLMKRKEYHGALPFRPQKVLDRPNKNTTTRIPQQ